MPGDAGLVGVALHFSVQCSPWKIHRYLYIMKQTDYTGYDVEMMTKIKLIDAGPEGYVEWELPITSFYSNMNDVMHGGAAGVLLGTSRRD